MEFSAWFTVNGIYEVNPQTLQPMQNERGEAVLKTFSCLQPGEHTDIRQMRHHPSIIPEGIYQNCIVDSEIVDWIPRPGSL